LGVRIPLGSPIFEESVVEFDIKAAVKDGKKVQFRYYQDGQLWYETETHVLFPVPISDVGSTRILAEDKAMLFMRWMRKYAETLKPVSSI
jgi:hypothetical protein